MNEAFLLPIAFFPPSQHFPKHFQRFSFIDSFATDTVIAGEDTRVMAATKVFGKTFYRFRRISRLLIRVMLA
jgi:hypothetical protein